MSMGCEIHIQSFYCTEGILHKERLTMVNGLSVRVKIQKPSFVQRIFFRHTF